MTFGPEEIKSLAAEAWSSDYHKMKYCPGNKPKFVNKGDKKFFDFSHLVEDLEFNFEFYSTRPKKQHGTPVWEKVVPYNSCYLPADERNKEVQTKELNPVEMWLEDRWILVRRIYGSVLTQKLFIQCLSFVYGLHQIRGAYFHAIQNAIVRELFDQDPREFFGQVNRDTWVQYWDGSFGGNLSQNTTHYLSSRINMMGPTAAIFGRDFELFMLEEYKFTMCPTEILEESIRSCWGTLNKQAFEREQLAATK